MDTDPFPTFEGALAEAEKCLAQFQNEVQEEKLAPLDERGLGIDDTYRDLATRLRNGCLCVQWAVPLGCFGEGAIPDMIEDWLDGVSEADCRALANALPRFVAAVREEWADETPDSDRYLLPPRDTLLDEIAMSEVEGVLIHASQPFHENLDDGMMSIHGGISTLGTFYGETFEVACEAALNWAEAQIADAKSKPPKERKKTVAA